MTPRILAALLACLPGGLQAAQPRPATIDGVTFFDRPNEIQVPARQAAKLLGWKLSVNPQDHELKLNGKHVKASQTRELEDGTATLSLQALRALGATVNWNSQRGSAALKSKGHVFFVRKGAKRVVINRTHQELRAFQGGRLVLKSPISTGVEGYNTPIGTWHLKSYRSKMHRSRLYHDAPMPWSVQVAKDMFIHGAASVDGRPASHGCIRLPMSGNNAARWFYYWAEPGTPVTVSGNWPKRFSPG
jgi:lipoprotein-anchoring transpeptidase ErfK/SrfK